MDPPTTEPPSEPTPEPPELLEGAAPSPAAGSAESTDASGESGESGEVADEATAASKLDSPDCINCGTPLAGPFCHQCGQKKVVGKLRLGHLASQAWQQFTDVDRGFLHTFIMLCRSPGQVAVDYVEGRRARHCPPLRYFLILLAVLYVTPALIGLDLLTASQDSANAFTALVGQPSGVDVHTSPLVLWILENRRLVASVAIPIYALFTWPVFFPCGRSFAEHLVFFLYVDAHLLVPTVATYGFRRLDVWPWWADPILNLLMLAYVLWALQRFVGQPWWICTLKIIGACVSLALWSCMLGSAIAMLSLAAQ